MITLDSTNPNGTLYLPMNATITSNTTVNLSVNASDLIELKNATLFVYNESGVLINETDIEISGTNATFGIVYNFLYDGIFNWSYRVYDVAGNSFYAENYTITIDTTYLNCSIFSFTSNLKNRR